MRLLVFGGRRWYDQDLTNDIMTAFHKMLPIDEIVMGTQILHDRPLSCGADLRVWRWTEMVGIPVVFHRPDYARYGRDANKINAKHIAHEVDVDIALRFPGLKHTLVLARHLDYNNVPVIDAEGIVPNTLLPEEERERRRTNAEAMAAPQRPHHANDLVARVKPHIGPITNEYTQRRSGVYRLTNADRYELWLERKMVCPFCKAWHAPGTRHANMGIEESAAKDAEMARRHEELTSLTFPPP